MKKYLLFALCSIGFGCAATAFADPNTTLPPRPIVQCTLPARACDCDPCTCPPGTCTCPGCALGCKKAGASAVADATYEVGMTDFQAPAVQYRQQCVNGVCSLVPVTMLPQASSAAPDVCPCCGMKMTPDQASKMRGFMLNGQSQAYGVYSAYQGVSTDESGSRRGPIRRLFGRFRNRGAGGCGG